MGVGAIFVSTLALSELRTPHNPPQGQEEFLAATLQIIVSFIVLCSIIIRRCIRFPAVNIHVDKRSNGTP